MSRSPQKPTSEQLLTQLKKLRQDLLHHRRQLRSGSNKNVRKPTLLRRQIARNLTRQRELQLQASPSRIREGKE